MSGHTAIMDVLVHFFLFLLAYGIETLEDQCREHRLMYAFFQALASFLMGSFTTTHMTACKKGPDLDPCGHPAEVVLKVFTGRTLS